MNKAAKLFLGAIVGFASVTAANADTTITKLQPVSIGTDDTFEFVSNPPPKFTDKLKFVMGSAGADAVITFSDTDVNGAVDVVLKDNTTHTQVGGTCVSTTCTFTDLTKGDLYAVVFKGKSVVGDISSINGSLNITAAVPEPGSLAMILAGVGFLGVYQLRRRGKSRNESFQGSALA